MPSLNTGNAILSNAIAVDSSYNVGIGGSASGTNKLQVTGIASANSFIPTSSTIPSNGLYLPSANTLGFATNGTLDMTLDTNGNLGLGVTPSAWATIKAMQILNTSYGASPNNLISYISSNVFFDGSFKYITTGTASQYRMNDSGAFSWLQAASGTANNAISFTTAMTLDASGRLGIGTSSPANTLDVQTSSGVGSSTASGLARFITAGTTTAISVGQANSARRLDIRSYQIITTGDQFNVSTSDANDIAFDTNNTERLRIKSNGSISFSTNSTLTTDNNTITPYGPNGFLYIAGGSTGLALAGSGNRDNAIYINTSSNILTFVANNAERMRITSGGRLLVGTSTDYGYKTTILDSLNGLFVRVESESSGATPFLVQNNNSGGTNIFEIKGHGFTKLSVFTYNNTTSNAANLFINTDGGLYRSTASTSRVKDNIVDWNGNGLDTILALKPRTFNYKANYYSHPEIEMLGLIAEEVAEVCPYLAEYENQDRTGQVENVKYATIVVPLIKAIQELSAKVENQQQTINSLINR